RKVGTQLNRASETGLGRLVSFLKRLKQAEIAVTVRVEWRDSNRPLKRDFGLRVGPQPKQAQADGVLRVSRLLRQGGRLPGCDDGAFALSKSSQSDGEVKPTLWNVRCGLRGLFRQRGSRLVLAPGICKMCGVDPMGNKLD